MFCERCGAELEPDTRFCSGCGAQVGEESADAFGQEVAQRIYTVLVSLFRRQRLIAGFVSGNHIERCAILDVRLRGD